MPWLLVDKNTKGIVQFAADFKIFGVRCFWLGILVQTYRERRLVELFTSGVALFRCKLLSTPTPERSTPLEEHDEVFTKYDTSNAAVFVSREQSICVAKNLTVICEYGQPGSRILVINKNSRKIYSPYRNENVWHLHAIVYLGGDYFLVSTGDTIKALDLFKITALECRRVRRVQHRLAGYTAMHMHDKDCWVGSDFSERANFIMNMSEGKKYYLPKDSLLEYVIHVDSINTTKMQIITRRLGKFKGHSLIFCTLRKKFLASNRIDINAYCK